MVEAHQLSALVGLSQTFQCSFPHITNSWKGEEHHTMIAEDVGLLSPFDVQSHKRSNESRRAIMFDIGPRPWGLFLAVDSEGENSLFFRGDMGVLHVLKGRECGEPIDPFRGFYTVHLPANGCSVVFRGPFEGCCCLSNFTTRRTGCG